MDSCPYDIHNLKKFKEEVIDNPDAIFYVFAYGSLIWYPNFEFAERIYGYVDGVRREVTQGNLRIGTEDWYGRVATLVRSYSERTWGVAYKIMCQPEKQLAYERLIKREIDQGYDLATVKFQPIPPNDEPFTVAVYIALPNNTLYLKADSIDIQAFQIARACGPYGPGADYILNLASFLRSDIEPLIRKYNHLGHGLKPNREQEQAQVANDTSKPGLNYKPKNICAEDEVAQACKGDKKPVETKAEYFDSVEDDFICKLANKVLEYLESPFQLPPNIEDGHDARPKLRNQRGGLVQSNKLMLYPGVVNR